MRRYDVADRERVKDDFRGFLPDSQLATVSKIVGQSSGLVMPKHAAPGFAPVVPQLRPDDPVLTDSRKQWHYHGSPTKERPVFPPEAGERRAGKPLPKALILCGDEAHINRAKGELYDPETGYGSHHGENREDVHFHLKKAKYVLFGEGKSQRIDVHPWAFELMQDARRVFFVLEGTPKNDAVLSAGEAVFNVPSVTLWNPRELREFARRFLLGKTIFIVPDADWFTNPDVNRQALLVRSCIRREGVWAHVAAPPVEGLERDVKGVDDFLGIGGGRIDGLIVRGRESPLATIFAWGQKLSGRTDRIRRAIRALEGLSLHAREDGSVYVPMGTLARIMDTRKRGVVDTLEDLASAIEVEGSLVTEIEEWDGHRILNWVERPTITVKPEFRALEKPDETLGQLWAREDEVTREEFEHERQRNDERWAELDRFKTEQERLQAQDVVTGAERLLATQDEMASE